MGLEPKSELTKEPEAHVVPSLSLSGGQSSKRLVRWGLALDSRLRWLTPLLPGA